MLSIRAANRNDIGLLKALICELAEYERERDRVVITEADLARDGFGPQSKFRGQRYRYEKRKQQEERHADHC
jgi:hypothetical protein